MNPKNITLSAVVLIFWASAFVGIQRASSLIDPGSFALYRLLISSLTLYLIARFQRMRYIPTRDQIPVALSGITGSTVYIFFVNLAQPYVSSTETCIFINTVPAFAALGGWLFLQQPVSRKSLLGLGISFIGIVILAQGKGNLQMSLGVVYLLLAALSMAVSMTLQKKLLYRYSSLQVISTGLWWGALACLPWATSLMSSFPVLSLEGHMLVIYLGVFPSALVYLAWGILLKSTSTYRATSLLYLIPVLVSLMGYLYLGETLTLPVVMGGVFALVGVALIQLPTPKFTWLLTFPFRRPSQKST